MGRKKLCPDPGTRQYGLKSNYTVETINEALEKIKSGAMTQREAARIYKIPRSTLKYKLQGKHDKKTGRPPVFSSEEENLFIQHILAVSELGLPVSLYDVRCIVKQYLDKSKRNVPTFSNNMPGWEWGKLFLERHNVFSAKLAVNIARKRAQVDENAVKQYFSHLENELKDVPPENIYNFDETGFHDTPTKCKLLFRRSCRHPEVVRNSTKSCFTVMFCGNAVGEMLPPYIIFKGKHKWSDWLYMGPLGSRMNVTKSGWMDSDTFEDWFEMHLLPVLQKKEGKKIIIGDNLSSHISIKTLQLCDANNIKFICLIPNSTHLLQPLDVGYFAALKTCWRSVLLQWRQTKQGKKAVSLPNNLFAQLLKRTLVMAENTTKSNLIAGFRATGTYPTSKEYVLAKLPVYTKPANTETEVVVGDAFQEYLSSIRDSDLSTVQRGRKFQLPVIPGKSVTAEEVEEFYRNRENAGDKPKGL